MMISDNRKMPPIDEDEPIGGDNEPEIDGVLGYGHAVYREYDGAYDELSRCIESDQDAMYRLAETGVYEK